MTGEDPGAAAKGFMQHGETHEGVSGVIVSSSGLMAELQPNIKKAAECFFVRFNYKSQHSMNVCLGFILC